MGNVVGSKIANIGLDLAACAVIAPVLRGRGVLRFECPFLLLTSWIALLLSRARRWLEMGDRARSALSRSTLRLTCVRGGRLRCDAG